MDHWDGTLGQVEDREGGGRETSQQDLDSRGDYRVGQEMREIGQLQVKILLRNAMLPVRGSTRVAGYDLCAASNYVIPSQDKGTIEIGLVGSLPPGTYAQIAPHSGLAIQNFIDVGVGVLDWDYWCKIKVVLFKISSENFIVQMGDSIGRLIL